MLPGPKHVYSCPHCGGLCTVGTWATFHQEGILLTRDNWQSVEVQGFMWSDGVPHGSRSVAPVACHVCPACRRIFWLEDAEHVDTFRTYFGWSELASRDRQLIDAEEAKAEKYKNTPRTEEPKLADYWKGLRESALASSKELALRLGAWRLANNPQRNGRPPRQTLVGTANLKRLANLLPGSIDEWLLPEVYRHQGLFNAARRALKRPRLDDVSKADQLEWIDAEDRGLRMYHAEKFQATQSAAAANRQRFAQQLR